MNNLTTNKVKMFTKEKWIWKSMQVHKNENVHVKLFFSQYAYT